jgi:hypothetical protein
MAGNGNSRQVTVLTTVPEWICQTFMTSARRRSHDYRQNRRGGQDEIASTLTEVRRNGTAVGPASPDRVCPFHRPDPRAGARDYAMSLTNASDAGRAAAGMRERRKAASGQIGRKTTVPYGLYRAHGLFPRTWQHRLVSPRTT